MDLERMRLSKSKGNHAALEIVADFVYCLHESFKVFGPDQQIDVLRGPDVPVKCHRQTAAERVRDSVIFKLPNDGSQLVDQVHGSPAQVGGMNGPGDAVAGLGLSQCNASKFRELISIAGV
jgi:hypothetical protein